ncbi:MAG: GAF domain-containing protein [Bacteroidales bacterium]|nr:GAF domain-containing protein [Bacteroidales bacterium]
MKLKLQSKLFIYILTAALVVFVASTVYLHYKASTVNLNAITRNIRETEKNSALRIKSALDCDISSVRALAASISGTELLTEEQRVSLYRSAANRFLSDNTNFENLKISWELAVIDNSWTKNFGRRLYTFERGDGGAKCIVQTLNLDGDDFASNYYKAKVMGHEIITGIESEDSDNPNIRPLYKSTIYIPVFDNEGNFCALVSADLEVENFHRMVKNSVGYESVASFLLTDAAQFAGMSVSQNDMEKSDIMKLVASSYYDVRSKIDSSGFANIPVVDSTGKKLLICGVNVDNKIFNNSWTLVTAVPQSLVYQQSGSLLTTTILIVLAGMALVALLLYHITSKLSAFLDKSGDVLKDLSNGNTSTDASLQGDYASELHDIAVSVSNLKDGLGKAVKFAEEIGKGNLDSEFQPLSQSDELGISLLRMRDSLVEANKETTERQELDRRRNWITQGAAKFGDILREYNNDMYDFSFNIISNLVKYIGANQGGLFVINDDNKDDVFFELTAGYAYDIRKILKKTVYPGVGLIGRCILEADTIYISNLPEDYINITSGLGEKSPQHLLIVPFKFNNEIYAVAEVASFNPIEEYQKQFIEEVGNSIASTIATVKINIRTNKLLQELKIQSDELVSQEEEMRQNMESMRTSQEDMTKKVDEYTQVSETLNQIIMTVTYTSDGTITDVSDKALQFLKKPKQQLISGDEPLYEVIHESEKTNSDDFWLQIRLGRQKVVSRTINIMGQSYNITETYSPVQNFYGKVFKVICLIDVSGEGIIRSESSASASSGTTETNSDGEWF